VNSQVTWIMHQPVQTCDESSGCPEFRISSTLPAMEPRVASNLASFNATGARAQGRPSAAFLQWRLPMRLRVTPHPASSGHAGDGSSSCLESRILWRCRRWDPRYPCSLTHPVAPSDESPGSTRFLHLPALPAMELRVAPNLASFSASGASALGHPAARSPVAPADDSPGCPGLFIFRLCRRWSLESPLVSHPSALPGLELWVSPQLCSSESASQCGCELPRIRTFRLCLG